MCMGRTHMLTGAAGWLGYAAASGETTTTALGLAAVCAAGALLPDLDHPNSLIAHRLHIRWFCRIVARLSGGHRHATHSALAVVAVLWGVSYLTDPLIAAAAATGVAAHIVGDCLTPEGCPVFWPIPRRFTLRLFTTGTWPETILAVASLAACVWFAHLIVPGGIWSPA